MTLERVDVCMGQEETGGAAESREERWKWFGHVLRRESADIEGGGNVEK